MLNIVFACKNKLDPSQKKKAYTFMEKLSSDDTSPGLHIEKIRGSADERVRTGRVDDFLRAVLFKLTGQAGVTYVLQGIYPHDDAIAIAKRAKVTVNPVNGVTEIHIVEPPKVPLPDGATAPPSAIAAGAHAPGELAERPGPLASHGLTLPVLCDTVGIEPGLAERALAASEDQLLELAASAVEWQAEALLDLAAGMPVDQVLDSYELRAAPEPRDSDEAILEGTKVPAAAMTFTWIENNDELKRVIEEGTFGQWRVFLHPEQRRLAERDYNGPFRISGGAGTGKTVVLLHRTRRLASAEPEARTVLTTFTTTLADGLAADLGTLDPDLPLADRLGRPGVLVRGIDALAHQVLVQADRSRLSDAAQTVLDIGSVDLSKRVAHNAWRMAIDSSARTLPAELRSPAFFYSEYEMVVLPQRIATREHYLRARRQGRGVALDRAKRIAVWDVISAYRNACRSPGELDYGEIAVLAAAYLEAELQRTGRTLADHVLVDEGQDLSPARWQLLRALAAPGKNDLFIAEDSQQRIYGQRVRLSDFGIRIVGRSRRLTLNYRTTAQNLGFAMGVLAGAKYEDLEGEATSSAHFRSARSGLQPQIIACESPSAEIEEAARVVSGWLADGQVSPETIGLLTRERRQRDRLVSGLAAHGVPAVVLDKGAARPGKPVALTMHRAKGLEFSRVLLFGISAGSIPAALRDEQYSEESRTEASLHERALLYVAATRARDELVVTYSGDASEFLPKSWNG